MTDSRPYLSIVVPTYNSDGAVAALVAAVAEQTVAKGIETEMVIVDDRSPDATWSLLRDVAAEYPFVRGVRLQRNVGQMTATLCGISLARGDIVVTMDDDLQHPPSEIHKLCEGLEQNPEWDVVIGSWERQNDSGFRAFGSRVFGWIQDLALPAGRGLRHTGFRAMRRSVADALTEHGTHNPVMSSLPFEVTSSIHNVEVTHAKREIGTSNFSLRKSIKLTVDNFIQSSTLPLRFLAWFGTMAAALSALIGVVYLVRAVAGAETPPGWASTFLPVVFFGGAILMSIGLLGRYIELVMAEVRQAPRWVIRETTDG